LDKNVSENSSTFYLPHEKQIYEYLKTIEHLKKQNQDNPLFTQEIKKLEQKLELLKEKIYSQLTPWERVLICRHPKRPHTKDYTKSITSKFIELFGDRLFKDDSSIIGGLAVIEGQKIMLIGQEKGSDTNDRVYRNFGMVCPEGFRKALRLMKTAEKFNIPIVTLLDTPGAYPGLDAEQRGQSWAIAYNLREMSVLQVPVITLVIGEGCSGGALGMGVADVIAMLEHSYYSVISPEGCASILWKDAAMKQEAASSLKFNAENLLELGIIDEIIPEPLGGAHHNPQVVYDRIKKFIAEQCQILKKIPKNILLEQRYQKYRNIGKYLEREVVSDDTLVG
jgi:acetyl-CoA carboxylase carboxyl transferase subunit alpha